MIIRFSIEKQREMLLKASRGITFFETLEGQDFIAQLKTFFAPALIKSALQNGLNIEEGDVINLAILMLCEDQGALAKKIAEAQSSPWGYLYRCLLRQVFSETPKNIFRLNIETVEQFTITNAIEHDHHHNIDHNLTSVAELVRLCATLLEPLTPERLRDELPVLLHWLALNPPQRYSYEHETKQALALLHKSFSKEQISELVNTAWGVRPEMRRASLMAALLLNPEFDPWQSPVHRRRLKKYADAMKHESQRIAA